MYTSIASLHIALDNRLLLLNSNRKLSIHPEQYDMAINDAILTVIKQRFSPLNIKQQGFEDSVKRVTDLSSLKKIKTIPIVNSNQQFTIPSNCYLPISCNGGIVFDKTGIKFTESNITKYISILTLDSSSIQTSIKLKFQNETFKDVDVSKINKSIKTFNYTLNYLKEILEEEYNLDCYIENYNGIYKQFSLIIVTYDLTKTFHSANTTCTIENKTIVEKNLTFTGTSKIKNVDLISSENYNKIANDYYSYKNLHLNPVYKIASNIGYLNTNGNFKFKTLDLEYIKYPRLVNSNLNRMTDVTITDEILDIATTNLSGILENQTYQINLNKQQNNQ